MSVHESQTLTLEAFKQAIAKKGTRVYMYVQLGGVKHTWVPVIKSEFLSYCDLKRNGFNAVTCTFSKEVQNIYVEHFTTI
jgi:hypothetical protein